ncbi:MAG TPA: hypothetical protein VES59_02280 [Bacteroidota bacterium]|nr:hypothetical protein [Bacteroidota bacterium]
MKSPITLDTLKAERKALQEELQTIEKLITIHERRQRRSGKQSQPGDAISHFPRPLTARDHVTTTIYNLLHELKRPVSSKEIFERVDSLGILKDVKNKQATLSAILDQLTKTKIPKFKRVDRGVYDAA